MKNRTIAIVFAVLFVTVSGGLGLMIVRSAKRETAPVAAKPVAIEVAKAVVEVAKPENDQDRFEREDREIMRLIGIHHREESRIKILAFLETHAQKDTLKSTPGEALAIARILARSIVISGDPERRDFDKFHLVVNGFFVRSGHRSVYTDWFQEVADETKRLQEDEGEVLMLLRLNRQKDALAKLLAFASDYEHKTPSESTDVEAFLVARLHVRLIALLGNGIDAKAKRSYEDRIVSYYKRAGLDSDAYESWCDLIAVGTVKAMKTGKTD